MEKKSNGERTNEREKEKNVRKLQTVSGDQIPEGVVPESRPYGQMCLCARGVCACVEYASACDESGIARCTARAVESFYTRDQAICPARRISSDKRCIIIPCVVLVTRFTRRK